MVRAKFRCETVQPSDNGSQTIMLVPVGHGGNPNPENEKFFKSTPHGQINLSLVHPDAAKEFRPGVEYFIDFTSVHEQDAKAKVTSLEAQALNMSQALIKSADYAEQMRRERDEALERLQTHTPPREPEKEEPEHKGKKKH